MARFVVGESGRLLFAAIVLVPTLAFGQAPAMRVDPGPIVGTSVRGQANAILNMVAYSALPGAGATALDIRSPTSGHSALLMGQLGSGFTVSDSLPVYLEGYAGYARYDPKFVLSNGVEQRRIQARWNDVAGTVGIGWDFKLSQHWVLRPIATLTLGTIASDAALAGYLIERKTDADLRFLSRGTMNVYGLGGALVLAYYIKKPEYEYDLELRGADIRLSTFGGTSEAVRGTSNIVTLSVWTRMRWPTGIDFYDRPLRYVVDFQHSFYPGEQAAALGFRHLSTVGAGFEIDTSAHQLGVWGINLQRIRLLVRYSFGPNVSGWSSGLAVSF